MATTTKTYTKTINVTGYTSCTITYTLTETETTGTIAFTKIAWKNTRSTGITQRINWTVDALGSGIGVGFPNTTKYGTAAKGSKTWSKTLSGVSRSGEKLEQSHTATTHLTIYMTGDSTGESWSKDVDLSLSVPAKKSYPVTYNANGGSGAPSAQTKWHGEALLLSSVTPTMDGYSFKCWNTNASGTGTNYNKGASYASDAALNLYAVWEPWITGIMLSVNTLRVADSTTTAESDEGTWCYGTCDYTVTGAAAGDLALSISVSPQDTTKEPPEPSIQGSAFAVTKTAGQALTGSVVFRASGCSTESSYTFTVDASCANTTTGTTQTAVEESQSDVLSVAYFTMDVLGDKYWDKNTQTGERPGHGIAFGEPAKWEGFRVGMKPYFGEYPVKDTSDDYLLIVGNGTADNARSNALAVKWDGTVETAQDIPWTTLPLSGDWTAYSNARTPKYRRVGSLVEIRGAIKPTASTTLNATAVTFANLPQGCHPANMEVSALCNGSATKMWLLTVDTDGNVGASRMRTTNSTNYQSAGTSEFMIFDVMFFAG